MEGDKGFQERGRVWESEAGKVGEWRGGERRSMCVKWRNEARGGGMKGGRRKAGGG